MSRSSSSPPHPRVQLGSPVIPVNASGTYLRHRAAAERASRARRHCALRGRGLAILAVGLLYLAIGHELVQLTRAKARLLCTEVRSDAHLLAKDLKKITALSRARADPEAALPEGVEAISERGRQAEVLMEQP